MRTPSSTLECEKLKVVATASLLLIATMTAWPDAASSQDSRDIVSYIHEQITKTFPKYEEDHKTKALAGCISWKASTPEDIYVRHLVYYVPAEGNLLASQLMKAAVNSCNEQRKHHGSICKCVPISKNGRPALKIPDAFIEKARAFGPIEMARAHAPPIPVETFRDCPDCPEMVVIPAGSFMMGSAESDSTGYLPERPQHRVTIPRPFALGKYEVTFAEWDACARAGGCSHRPDDLGWGRGNRPVINVSWDDANQYVRWLSRQTGEAYRLPSEAEWEYAARAGTTSRYYWGDRVGRGNANCDGCGGRRAGRSTAPVGSFPANRFGLYDMSGNVWEWVEDCWNDSYRGAPTNGRAWTSGQCSRRVLRGGGTGHPKSLRSAYRHGNPPDFRAYGEIGFRVAKTLP